MIGPVEALLLDIDGFLTEGVGGAAYPGGPEAVTALAARYGIRYVTNATSRSRARIAEALAREGYPGDASWVVNPASLARPILEARGHARGILLSDPGADEDLSWFQRIDRPQDARAVLLASEAHDRTIRELGPAVDALRSGATLYALQQNRVFRKDGRLLTDVGPVAAFLGYAADVGWDLIGKPSPLAFQSISTSLGVPLDRLLMAGDDAEFDCAGALRAGVGFAILARTGKYMTGEEFRVSPPPSAVVSSIAELPSLLA